MLEVLFGWSLCWRGLRSLVLGLEPCMPALHAVLPMLAGALGETIAELTFEGCVLGTPEATEAAAGALLCLPMLRRLETLTLVFNPEQDLGLDAPVEDADAENGIWGC